jgi:hypothetical protein
VVGLAPLSHTLSRVETPEYIPDYTGINPNPCILHLFHSDHPLYPLHPCEWELLSSDAANLDLGKGFRFANKQISELLTSDFSECEALLISSLTAYSLNR